MEPSPWQLWCPAVASLVSDRPWVEGYSAAGFQISLDSFPFSDFLSPLLLSSKFFSWEIYLKIIIFYLQSKNPE